MLSDASGHSVLWVATITRSPLAVACSSCDLSQASCTGPNAPLNCVNLHVHISHVISIDTELGHLSMTPRTPSGGALGSSLLLFFMNMARAASAVGWSWKL